MGGPGRRNRSGPGDLLAGYAAYVPATLVIKALMGLLAALGYRWARDRCRGLDSGVRCGCGNCDGAGYALYDAFWPAVWLWG